MSPEAIGDPSAKRAERVGDGRFVSWGGLPGLLAGALGRASALVGGAFARTFRRAGREGPGGGDRPALAAPPRPPRRSARHFLSVVTCTTALWGAAWATLERVDPFGLIQAADRYSQEIVDRAFAPLYRSEAQGRIAVVLIDDHTLRAHDVGWPPPYTYHRDVVRRIMAHRPEAVFLDLVFEHRRRNDPTYGEAMAGIGRAVDGAGARLLVARSDRGAVTLPELAGASALVGGALAGWTGYGAHYPPLVGEDPDGCADPQDSAALALYRLACPAGGAPGCLEPAPAAFDAAFCRPMAVQWGRVMSPDVRRFDLMPTDACKEVGGSWPERIADMGYALLKAALRGLDEGAREDARVPCAYATTLFGEDLDDPDRAAVLEGRIVLVGVQVAGIQDHVVSPVHGRIPGVYLHAMALDNLMTYGRRYFAEAPPIPFIGLNLAHAVMAALAMALVGIAYARQCRAADRGRAVGAGDRLAVFGLGLLLVIGAVALMHGALRWPPVNWVGFAGLFALISSKMETE